MRACTSTHLFQEVSPGYYVHNAFSSIFLQSSNQDMFVQMYDCLGQAVYSMPHFLKETDYRNPTDYSHSPFQYGHRTDLGFWEWLEQTPEKARVFNSGMKSLATITSATGGTGNYPFEEQLGREEIKPGDVVIVDVGGGGGQVLEAIKAEHPNLKGRMILQDSPAVIQEAKANGLPSYIEPMAASFFERQPVEGKHIDSSIKQELTNDPGC